MKTASRYPEQQLFYAGANQAATSGRTFRTLNPADASLLADIQIASEADIDAAVQSAEKVFSSWAKTPPMVRARILMKAVKLLREHNDEIAEIETLDTGKPFSETSAVDVVTGADVLEYYASMVGGGGLNGETVQLREDAWVYTKKAPLGVCAGIGAWNYPIQM
jgi:betaine-aldehyde dehydrogenase